MKKNDPLKHVLRGFIKGQGVIIYLRKRGSIKNPFFFYLL